MTQADDVKSVESSDKVSLDLKSGDSITSDNECEESTSTNKVLNGCQNIVESEIKSVMKSESPSLLEESETKPTVPTDEEKLTTKTIINGKSHNNNNTFTADLNKPSPILIKTVLTDPGYEYWRRRSPMADKIFITDVTVDLNTVTIRECATEKGFFRERSGSGENEPL